MTHHTLLLSGVAEAIATASLGVYRATGIYQPSERGIVIGTFPETPNELISIGIYEPTYTPLSPSARAQITQSHVQIKWRTVGNPLTGIEIFDQLNTLISRQRFEFAGVVFRGAYKSFGSIGQDANNRHQFTSNWVFTALEATP